MGAPVARLSCQHVLGGEQPVVVLDDEPSAHREGQRRVRVGEPLERARLVAVRAAHVQHDLSARIHPERVEERRVVCQVELRPLHHVGIGRVQHGVLAGVHAQPDAMAPRLAPERGQMRLEVAHPIERVHGARPEGDHVRADAEQVDAVFRLVVEGGVQRAQVAVDRLRQAVGRRQPLHHRLHARAGAASVFDAYPMLTTPPFDPVSALRWLILRACGGKRDAPRSPPEHDPVTEWRSARA